MTMGLIIQKCAANFKLVSMFWNNKWIGSEGIKKNLHLAKIWAKQVSGFSMIRA